MVEGLYNKKRCSCPPAKTTWNEEPPYTQHRYRVVCGYCKTFMKWGTEAELAVIAKGEDEATVVPYRVATPGPTLDEFFT